MAKVINLKASTGMIELDGDSLRVPSTDDLPAILRLRDVTRPELFEIPSSAAELAGFLEALAQKTWSLPMLCCHLGRTSGLCLMNLGQLKNLNANLVALFEEPATAERLLALYLRQAFWAFPLHRLYAQLPISVELQPHIDLLLRTGFRDEGVLVGHIEAADSQSLDAIVLGILRDEFDLWCANHEPRLSLA